jgi:hypothetical protein
MTYQELEELGLQTVAKDTHSFVSKTTEEYVWLEFFCCNEKDYLQIMRVIKGGGGEVIRKNLYEGNINMTAIKQFLK